MLEAKLIGLKEGFKVAVVWLVLYSVLVLTDRKRLIKPFYLGIVTVIIVSIVTLSLPAGLIAEEYLSNIIAMSFALFLMAAAAALFHASGTNLLGPFKDISLSRPSFSKGIAGSGIVFFITLLFFLPDFIGSILYLKDLAFMRDTGFVTYVYALVGFLFALLILFLIIRFYKPYWIGDYFDIPQLLLFLAIVKLLGGGIKGISEMSLIPAVQTGFMKFVHDFVHQVLVLNLIPDHPLLQATVWNFIGIFFGAGLASGASLIILLFFPLIFIYYRLFTRIPEPEAATNVQKRKIKARTLAQRRKKALPVILFAGLILFVWFSQRGETISQLYVPEPIPVVASKGEVAIPLSDPAMDLMNGSLHTFSLVHEGEEIRILIVKRPDNILTVSLDACEICPPEGYGQREDHVVCLYCGTPLHIDSMGKPGGCNPIPLSADIDGRFIRIELKEILNKWGFVKTAENKTGIR